MPQDVQAFRDAFAMRASEYPTEKVDPAIVKCMDIAMTGLRKGVKGANESQKIQSILDGYIRAIQAEETFATEYSSISGAMSFGAGRVAIGVRMGAVSRLKVFNASTGAAIPVPKALDWSYRFEAKPQFAPGGLLIVNGPGIQDAGVRYAYRILFLKGANGKYDIQQALRGLWTLEDESESHLRVNGLVASVNTIEPPKAFFTDNVTRLFIKNTIYELDQMPMKVRMTSSGSNAIRVVDEWMSQAMANPKTDLQKQFVNSYGKERQMVDSFSEKVISDDTYEVNLEFEKTYTFIVKSKGLKESVESMKIGGE